MDLTGLTSSLLSGVSNTSANRNTQTSSLAGMDFQQMFSTMLMSSGLGSTGASDGLSGSSANMSSMFMLPAMFMMMEHLLMKQMELLQAGKLVSETTAATPAADTAVGATAATTSQSNELRQPAALVANQERAKAALLGLAPVDTSLVSTTSQAVPGTGHDTPFGEPVHGPLTQGYHSGHNGLDIGIVTGTQVHSSMNGKVIYAGWSQIGYGNLVIVQNGDYQTYYAHLSKIPVTVGQTVTAGDVIGLSGSTGNSTGPHLHYEIRYKGKNIDPTKLTLKREI